MKRDMERRRQGKGGGRRRDGGGVTSEPMIRGPLQGLIEHCGLCVRAREDRKGRGVGIREGWEKEMRRGVGI